MKKTLALVLALVMVIGMMAVPASAAYTDAADIEYKEAVDVMSAIGVIEGYNNEFNPKGELTRAAGAKLVAYLELGAKAAEALTATEAPFADVPADHWAAGYIGWAAGKGYLNGVGDNKFAPDAPLTAIAYAKLMLCALGYDAAIEGFTGDAWAYNVLETALEIDLFDGNEDADMAATATREEAALYSLNALMADMVKYETKGTSVEINGAVISTGASAATKVTSADSATIKDEDAGDDDVDTVQLAEKRYGKLELTVDVDAFARPANIWEYDLEKVGTYAVAADLTYTNGVKGKDIFKALGKPEYKGEAEDGAVIYNYYVDGVEDDPVVEAGFAAINKDEGKKLGKNGVLTEIYENAASTKAQPIYDVIQINTYVGMIADWNEAKDDVKENVSVVALNGGENGSFDTTAFTEDDIDETVVLYTYSAQDDGAIKSVVAAESVTGKITATNGNKFTVNGTEYDRAVDFKSVDADGEEVAIAYDKDADEVVVYTDAYGYAIYVEGAEEADAQYVLVLDAAEEGTWTNTSKTYSAKVVFPGSDVEETITLKNEASYNECFAADDDFYKGVLCSYKLKDGKYELTAVAAVDSAEGFVVDPAKAALSTGTIVNSKTQFVVVTAKETFTSGTLTKLEDYKYETVTGIKNMDKLTGDANTFVAVAAEDGVAKVVVVLNGDADKTASIENLIFVQKATKSSDKFDADHEDGYITVTAYVNGEKETLKVLKDSDAYDAIQAGDVVAYGYETDDGLVTAFDAESEDFAIAELAEATLKYNNGNLKVGEDAYEAFGEGASVYYVDNDAKTFTEGKVENINEREAVEYIAVYALDDDGNEVNIVALYIYEA